MSIFSRSKKLTNLEFHELCQKFYKTALNQELNSDQVEELAIMSTTILINLALNYYRSPLDLKTIVMRSFDTAMVMSDEHSVH